MSLPALRFLDGHFWMAHAQAPGGLSVEVGTRQGGSALMMLHSLELLYSEEKLPALFTVDPYGWKPYQGGDIHPSQPLPRLYGESEYKHMKQLLADFPNHFHWPMESLIFCEIADRIRYWHRGMQCQVKNLTFVFLDGDHDAGTIEKELVWFGNRLHPLGLIVVDNVDKDPETVPMLARRGWRIAYGPAFQPGARQAVLHGRIPECTR